MTIRTINWCTATQLSCDGSIPVTAYLCVTPSIVEPAVDTPSGFVEATLTAVRPSTCADPCGPCKWVYTITYDDEQLIDGFALTANDINSVLCGSDCLVAFIVDQASCARVRECISVEDTESVDMTYDESTGVISAEVNVSEMAGNAINELADGLFVTPGAISCDDVEACYEIRYCWSRATTEAELIAINTAGVGGVLIADDITLTAPLTVTIPMEVLPCGSIITNGNELNIEGSFSAQASQVFTTLAGDVLFTEGAVEEVLPEWFGAVNDGVVNCTTAINIALASTRGIVQLCSGIYIVTGLTLPNSVTIQGDGWQTIIRNTSAVNHTISYTGPTIVTSAGIKIADLAIEHTGSGSAVDGVHLENVSSFVRIEHVYVLDAKRHGIYIESDGSSHTGALYSVLDQVKSEGAGFDGVFLNGAVNSLTIIGCRFGGNGRYGLNLDDTITGTTSFPNTVRVIGTDLPGNDYGIHENGHSNAFFGLRFESNITGDILFGAKSQAALFFGEAYGSGSGVISGTPLARATLYDYEFGIRQFETYGYLEYWDELLGARRQAPKRSVYNLSVPFTSAGSGTVNRPVGRAQDRLKVKRVSIIPDAAITGANTDNFRFALRNKQFGGGDIAVAAQTFSLGINVALLEDFELPIVVGNDTAVDGDVFYLQKTENGTGMATPNIAIQVEYGGY